MIIHDPAVYEIHFFAIPEDREEDGISGKDKPHPLVDFLNRAAAQFAQDVKHGPPPGLIRWKDLTEAANDLLTAVELTEVSAGFSRELDVRTLNDGMMLRTRAEHTGEFDIHQVKDLPFATPSVKPPEGVPYYLGVFHVWYLESDRSERAKRVEVAKALAGDCGSKWLAEAEPIVTPIGTMLFGVPPRQRHQGTEAPALDLIFVGGLNPGKTAQGVTVRPFMRTLPVLAFCHLKVQNAVDDIRFNWLPKVAKRESKLRSLLPACGQDEKAERERKSRDPLPQRGEDRQPHEQDLARNNEIMVRQADLVDAVVHVQADLRTMRINRDNFAAAAKPFKRVADKLKHLLIDRRMRGTELQADNDLGYAEGTLRLAETHFKSIEARAAEGQAQYLQRINRWVIVLGGLTLLMAVLAVLVGLLQAYLAWKALPGPTSSPPQEATKIEASPP